MSSSKKDRLARIKDEVKDLHPLLHQLLPKLDNVQDVEYTHGPNEMGADFVLSKTHDTFGYTEYVGVIAKVGRILQDFKNIERQIEECDVPRPFLGGKKKIRIDEIWVIATGTITKGAQEKIHEKYRMRKITFVDGDRLAKLTDKHVQTFWYDMSLEVGEYLTSLRTNNKLLDTSMSLLQIADKDFYVEQDIYEHEPVKYNKSYKRFRKKSKKINIHNIINKQNMILIEGGMGSGKSKLIRSIVDHYTTPEVYIEKRLLPVATTYKELCDKYDNDLDSLLRSHVDIRLHNQSKDIKYLILIDGFDEKQMSIEKQLSSLGSLSNTIRDNDNVICIITSRYLDGLDEARDFDRDLARYEIYPLTMTKTIEFISKLCKDLNITEGILEDLKKSPLFKELPRTPIAAILLAKLINENAKDIPSNMTELYSKYIELILGRWDIDKGLQSLKEYEALNNIIMDIAKYMIEHEITIISINEAQEFFQDYLQTRNLDIDNHELFDKMVDRCEIVSVNYPNNTFAFKHRTFAEFMYANWLVKNSQVRIDERAFQHYWMNIFFFCVGILRDCPEILKKLIDYSPASEPERWLKVINMGNYFLAAFASPYQVISSGLSKTMLEAASLYKDTVDCKVDSPFTQLPRLHILLILQHLIRNGYSYEFFKKAIEDSALDIGSGDFNEDLKAYAIYFLNAAYLDLDAKLSFDFLLEDYSESLPLDLEVMLNAQGKDMPQKTLLMKKQDKRVKKMLKGSAQLSDKIEKMYQRPVCSLIEE